MKRRTILAGAFAAATALAPAAFAEQAAFYFVDILKLQGGKSAADAIPYFDAIEPVVAKHGLVRALPQLNIANVMRGEVGQDLVNVWTVTDPEGSFQGIFDDPDYLEHIELRDSIFDLKNSTMMILVPNK